MTTDQPKRKMPGWLLVCIIILAVLLVLFCAVAILCSSMLFVVRGSVQEEAKLAIAEAEISMLESALNQYALDMGGYPSTEAGLEALRELPAGTPGEEKWRGPYFEDLPLDPWGGPYQYELLDADNAAIWSIGPDRVSGTEDDITNR